MATSRRPGAIALAVAVPVIAAAVALGLTIPAGQAVDAASPYGAASSGPLAASAPTASATTSASTQPSESMSQQPPSAATQSMARPTMQPEGPAQRPPAVDSGSKITALVNVKTDDPVFFITIDDGMYQDPKALAMVQELGIPITAFLTEWTTPENPEWFTEITSYGGSIQNHTMTHENLNDPKSDVEFEICKTQEIFTERFGTEPWMFRPPYGEGYDNDKVQQVASDCGISSIVLWNVTVAEGGASVEYWDAPLRPGDIVLIHFEKDLHLSLQKILDLAAEQGLTPASLADYI